MLWSFLLSVPIIMSAWLFSSSLTIAGIHSWIFYGAGIVLLAVGLPFWFVSAITLKKTFADKKLGTSGVFALCRNPIYAAWVLFLAPGALLFFRNPLLLLIPVVMYAVLRVFLLQEEAWLEEKFGEEYLGYTRRVNRIFPTINVRRICQ